ncbi:MAG: tyrosine-type recombinase/integrase, partial [Xenococcaceae cyanobacterium MO_234.B1]|nr:tyrosine-type recombinase/integrase [Xenococcaceae cyanobacterium MO_234.B1]
LVNLERSPNTIESYARWLKVYWEYLQRNKHYLLELYIKSLSKYSLETKRKYIGSLKTFLRIGNINKWFDVPSYFLEQYKYDYERNLNIDYIPDEVLRQLDEHLHLLPEPLQRLVILIRALGLRECEILQLRFDCLRQLKNGNWVIQFTNWKFQEQLDTLPINESLVAIIKEQQEYIVNHLGSNFPYLFCGNKGGARNKTEKTQFSNNYHPVNKVCSDWTFRYFLNKLSQHCNICDNSGVVWKFSSHQFRRTVATKMTNEGVRQYIIQSYLRHRSPDMMLHYAQLLPETIKEEMEEFRKQKKIIDITGRKVEQIHPELDNDIGLQWLRAKMQPKALAMGFCARPALLKPCPHANACMSCEHFRLDEDDIPALEEHLKRTLKLKVESKSMGYIRQIKAIEEDEIKLNKLISSLREKYE